MTIADPQHDLLDVRCEARLRTMTVTARCQLMAGHEASHITLGISHAARTAWIWDSEQQQVRAEPYQGELAAGRPWAPGQPEPEFDFG